MTKWLLVAVLLAGCAGPDAPPVLSGQTMGTTYTVRLAAPLDRPSVPTLSESIEAELRRVNGSMSTYDPASEVSRFNATNSTDWFPVTAELVSIVNQAQEISAATDGAFDVSAGRLVNIWGFGPTGIRDAPPSQAEIEAAVADSGFRQLEARTAPPALRKQTTGLAIDLSAIAKGFAVDLIARHLDDLGVSDYLVEVGGEVRVRGTRPDRSSWRIGVERPTPGGRMVQRLLQLRDAAIATSGDYRNFFQHDGKRFPHILDPRNGHPVTHELASVSVIAASALEADAWATALMVMGLDAGFALATERELAALFIVRSQSGFVEHPTPAFERRVRS